jgi:hypothetical protein
MRYLASVDADVAAALGRPELAVNRGDKTQRSQRSSWSFSSAMMGQAPSVQLEITV